MTSGGLRGMTIIALIHVVWLLLFPLGLYCCVRGPEKRSYLAVGILLIVLSLPALWFLRNFWLFDYLMTSREKVLAKVEHRGWKVALTQTPDADFYHTDFIIVSPEGRTNEVVYDADDSKWWHAESVIRSNRIYFFRGNSDSDPSPSYLDLEQQVFWSGHYQREERLADPSSQK